MADQTKSETDEEVLDETEDVETETEDTETETEETETETETDESETDSEDQTLEELQASVAKLEKAIAKANKENRDKRHDVKAATEDATKAKQAKDALEADLATLRATTIAVLIGNRMQRSGRVFTSKTARSDFITLYADDLAAVKLDDFDAAGKAIDAILKKVKDDGRSHLITKRESPDINSQKRGQNEDLGLDLESVARDFGIHVNLKE